LIDRAAVPLPLVDAIKDLLSWGGTTAAGVAALDLLFFTRKQKGPMLCASALRFFLDHWCPGEDSNLHGVTR
tara:strand:+ start:695 stop:910 length:216 start_codon:yes stop_codon:yes gene_type:complete